MSKRKTATTEGNTDSSSEDTGKTRVRIDYFFEFHLPDGSIQPLGLVLNSPTEANKVKTFLLESGYFDRPKDSDIKVCQKRYS